MKKDRFKKIGADILSDRKPSSMEDFLKDESDKGQKQGHHPDAQLHKSTNAQLHTVPAPDERLHVFIASQLNDKLMDEVYRRKKDPSTSKAKSSKRGVVEDALKLFLK